jgi:hypothetical protein
VLLPPLPESLTYLSVYGNSPRIDVLPDLPEHLEKLYYHYGGFLESDINEPHSEHIARFKEAKRTITRCATIKEALMESCWHPDRLASIIERFGSVPQWNHEFREYGMFDFTSLDEVL